MKEECIKKINEDISKLQKGIEYKNGLLKVIEQFSEINREVHRWDKEVYCTSEVNNKVNNFDMRHNCGCCSDSPLEVFPYIEIDGYKIYSFPSIFCIGEGDRSYSNWRDKFVESGISDKVINEIEKYIEENMDKEYEEG